MRNPARVARAISGEKALTDWRYGEERAERHRQLEPGDAPGAVTAGIAGIDTPSPVVQGRVAPLRLAGSKSWCTQLLP